MVHQGPAGSESHHVRFDPHLILITAPPARLAAACRFVDLFLLSDARCLIRSLSGFSDLALVGTHAVTHCDMAHGPTLVLLLADIRLASVVQLPSACA